MMKIAVASENGMVAGHFGHCEGFMIFDSENNKIVKYETIANPGHKLGFLPNTFYGYFYYTYLLFVSNN